MLTEDIQSVELGSVARCLVQVITVSRSALRTYGSSGGEVFRSGGERLPTARSNPARAGVLSSRGEFHQGALPDLPEVLVTPGLMCAISQITFFAQEDVPLDHGRCRHEAREPVTSRTAPLIELEVLLFGQLAIALEFKLDELSRRVPEARVPAP